jgi:hypothetical protein
MIKADRAIPWIGSLTIVGVLWVSIPWLSLPSFLILATPASMVESLWDSLPDGARSNSLHDILGIGANVVASLALAALFFVLSRAVERRPDRARRVLPWSAAVLMVLSAMWYAVTWEDGNQYQGPGFVYLNVALSAGAVFSLAAIAICWRAWRGPALPMFFLWWEFVWVLGCAFPWFGESF